MWFCYLFFANADAIQNISSWQLEDWACTDIIHGKYQNSQQLAKFFFSLVASWPPTAQVWSPSSQFKLPCCWQLRFQFSCQLQNFGRLNGFNLEGCPRWQPKMIILSWKKVSNYSLFSKWSECRKLIRIFKNFFLVKPNLARPADQFSYCFGCLYEFLVVSDDWIYGSLNH